MRLFTCKSCGHKMRFGARYCGRCHSRAPDYNTSLVFVTAALICGPLLFIAIAI